VVKAHTIFGLYTTVFEARDVSGIGELMVSDTQPSPGVLKMLPRLAVND
jgi:hypothetical protein